MRAHFLLGPAGSGKTWRCLAEIRRELKAAPGGPPLVLLAPKQATFQLERQLLESSDLAGYSRLQIVSFDRLANWLLETFATVPDLLDDEGRVMVLRALLAREQPALRVFRATARLPGFARQLSQLLREFQRHQLTPARLARLADRVTGGGALRDKLHDLHHLLRAYHAWLAENGIEDGDQLLDLATAFLRATPSPISQSPSPIAGLWLDGFAEMTPQELDLLCAVLPFCRRATLAFCLDEPAAASAQSWLSLWSVVRRTYVACRQRVQALPGSEVTVEELARDPARSRFAASPELAALEAGWAAPSSSSTFQCRAVGSNTPVAFDRPPANAAHATLECRATSDAAAPSPIAHSAFPPPPALRLVVCASPEAEAAFAAREILRHVQAGGRFRDCAVILRTLDHHHAALRRTFTRYGIPFFLDRREPVAHHPLAELTRFALRTLAYGWQPEDLFGALKSGLVHERDEDVDWLENLALAHGWRGAQWLAPLQVPEAKFNLARAEQLRCALTAPFQKLAAQISAETQALTDARPAHSALRTPHSAFEQSLVTSAATGAQLAAALRDFWETLGIEPRLQAWDDALARESASPQLAPSLHGTVLRQMRAWLENLERAFPAGRAGDLQSSALPLREWLPILEAGLSALSVGVIPPALDQVLVGSIDRSRNPELRLALGLGLNEGIFPAPPAPPVLLTEAEREILSLHDTRLGLDARAQLAHERYFAYIACTRSRARLVLTCAATSADGDPLHPSPIFAHVQRLCPGLTPETIPAAPAPAEAVHAEDLLAPLLQELAGSSRSQEALTECGMAAREGSKVQSPKSKVSAASGRHTTLDLGPLDFGPLLLPLATHAAFAPLVVRFLEISAAHGTTPLSPAAVAQLYGPHLASSVSKLEQFAECPFKFFVAAGLGAEERKEFEVDHRERGSFIHKLLDEFHTRVTATGRRWRDLSPTEAADLAARLGEELLARPEFAIFAADDGRRFAARTLIASAQRLLAALVGWMPGYAFDPAAVELAFGLGPDAALPAWRLALTEGRSLSLRGRIDRVDLHRDPATGNAFAVVVDYKSSPKKLDALKVANGLQLQLLAYLNVLREGNRRWEMGNGADGPMPQAETGTTSTPTAASTLPHYLSPITNSLLHPVGVFYVPLHGAGGGTGARAEVLAEDEAARRAAYQHAGRFDFERRQLLDARLGGQASGQFKLRLNKDGGLIARGSDALPTDEFAALLAQVEANLRRIGDAIFAGEVAVAPVRLSATDTACARCEYRPICRFDPWTQPFRALARPAEKEVES